MSAITNTFFNSSVLYDYDTLGRIVQRTVNGAPHMFTYDALSRLTSETNGLGLFAYTYLSNVSGRVKRVTYPNQTSANFEYYPANNERRLKKIWYDDDRVSYDPVLMSSHEYEYSPVGNITSWIQKRRDHANPNQVNQNNHTFAYDPINQLTSALQKRNNVTVNQYGYTYDKAGNRTKETVNSDVRGYGYNWLNQLLGVQTEENTGMIRFKGSVDKPSFVKVNGLPVYLAANNTFETYLQGQKGMNEVTVEATETLWGNTRRNKYSFNQTDDLLKLSHTYDADGNLTYDGTRTFTWDAKNQLTRITHADGTKTEFTYDGRGRRIKQVEKDKYGNITDEKRLFWVNGNQPFEERSSTNTVLKRYFAQGEHEVNSSGAAINKVFYEKDHLGSVRGLVNNNFTSQTVYDYDPYGRRTKVSGSLDTVVGYTGHHWHAKSGLYLTWFRQYNPETGRWLSRDPIEERGGINLYGYVGNNVTNLRDPRGAEPQGFLDNKVYRFLYTGDANASDEVYDAAMDAAGEYTYCYIKCMGDWNKQAYALVAGIAVTPIPKALTPYTQQAGALDATSKTRLAAIGSRKLLGGKSPITKCLSKAAGGIKNAVKIPAVRVGLAALVPAMELGFAYDCMKCCMEEQE